MQINSQQSDVSNSDNRESGTLNEDQFRVRDVPPGAAVLVDEAAVFNVA
jgi:hypothetical protein